MQLRLAIISTYSVSSVRKSLVAICACVAEVRTRVFNMFVTSTKRVGLQHQNCSSPDQHNTCSSLAMNAFVCVVISCSEVVAEATVSRS